MLDANVKKAANSMFQCLYKTRHIQDRKNFVELHRISKKNKRIFLRKVVKW